MIILNKRISDISSYKVNYEKWKKDAKEFIQNIKKQKKTYSDFDK